MSRIAIVYFSQSGTEVSLLRIRPEHIREGRWQDEATLQALSAADAIVFGAPTYMGGVAAQFKAFADATAPLWFQRGWKHKLAAGFTISGSPSGDKLHTLDYLAILPAQHGMVWLNWDELPRQANGINRMGSSMGLMAQNPAAPGTAPALDPADTLSAEAFGAHVARMTVRLTGAKAPQESAFPKDR